MVWGQSFKEIDYWTFLLFGALKTPGYKMQAQYFSSVLPERSAISLRLHRLGQLCPEIPEIAVVRLLNISVWGIKKTPNFTSGYFEFWAKTYEWIFYRESRANTFEWTFYQLLLRNKSDYEWIFYRQSRANTLSEPSVENQERILLSDIESKRISNYIYINVRTKYSKTIQTCSHEPSRIPRRILKCLRTKNRTLKTFNLSKMTSIIGIRKLS